MNHPAAALSPVIDTSATDLSTPDFKTLEHAYQGDVYDPRRDVRNHYPMIAQQMLMNPDMRKGLTEMARDICDSGMYGYKANDAGLAAVRAVAIKGFAMGMDLPRALETIKVIHGTPTIRGPQALHLIRERTRGATLECEESTHDKCVWLLGRPGQNPKRFTSTRQQIERAKLDKKNDLWNVYPERMLKWHAFSEGAQELFGDVLMGCYITEEMGLQYEFDRHLDAAATQSESARKGGRRSKKSESKPKSEAKPAPQESDPPQNQSPPEDKPEPQAPPASPKATAEQKKLLGAKVNELAKIRGARFPTEDMPEEQSRLVKQEWDRTRKAVWEQVSKTALRGKVAKYESVTQDEANALLHHMDKLIAEAGEA